MPLFSLGSSIPRSWGKCHFLFCGGRANFLTDRWISSGENVIVLADPIVLHWVVYKPIVYGLVFTSTLAWKIPWAEEPGRLQSMGSLRVGHDWAISLSLSCIGEGNGNPLQCSCLDNPRDGGAWWAAVYGVAQSWTRLKRLSSSSSMLLTSSPVLLVLLMVNIFWVEKLSRYFPIMKKWVSDLKWLVKWSAHLKGCFEKQMK